MKAKCQNASIPQGTHLHHLGAGAAFGSLGALLSAFAGALPPVARAALPGLPAAAFACAPDTGTAFSVRVVTNKQHGVACKRAFCPGHARQ